MKHLKILFLIMLMALIFVLGWFDPVSTVGRFILPEGCCRNFLEEEACNFPREKAVCLNTGYKRQLVSVVIPSE